MSLDAAAVTALANDLKAAKVACGAVSNPALVALCLAEATAIQAFVLKATPVVPITGAAGTTPGTIT